MGLPFAKSSPDVLNLPGSPSWSRQLCPEQARVRQRLGSAPALPKPIELDKLIDQVVTLSQPRSASRHLSALRSAKVLNRPGDGVSCIRVNSMSGVPTRAGQSRLRLLSERSAHTGLRLQPVSAQVERDRARQVPDYARVTSSRILESRGVPGAVTARHEPAFGGMAVLDGAVMTLLPSVRHVQRPVVCAVVPTCPICGGTTAASRLGVRGA
jgi:hypothetical protein